MFGGMAITATLVHAGHNRLRYLLETTSTGADTGTITTIGDPTPDILTDLGENQGPIMLLAKVVEQGYGQFAAGAQTQAKARALWLADRSGADPASGTTGIDIVPSAICRLTPRGGSASAWRVDANVDGDGNPELIITSLGVSDGEIVGECYLDVLVGDTIGD